MVAGDGVLVETTTIEASGNKRYELVYHHDDGREEVVGTWTPMTEEQKETLRAQLATIPPAWYSNAAVAQLAEHSLGKGEVHRFDPGQRLHFAESV